MSDSADTSNLDTIARTKIGREVIYASLITIFLLGILAIIVAITKNDSFTSVKDVLSMFLPLIGTWVGTVLAFYFSRENFAAAAQQTENIVRQLTPEQRLQSIPVIDAMIDMSASTTTKFELTTTTNTNDIKLIKDIIDTNMVNRNRLPIVDSTGKILFILHRSLIDQFLINNRRHKDLVDLTLQDLLNDQGLKTVIQSFGVISKDDKLISAKRKMDGNPNCSDVFVTEDGTKETKALGWLTNVIVQEKSTV